jgi:hypothetical protein
MAIVYCLFRRDCVAGCVFEHCHQNSGALVRITVWDLGTETGGRRSVSSGRATEIFVLRSGRWVNPGWHTDAEK